MCGITGFFCIEGDQRPTTEDLRRATDSIVHRGPDASGVWCSDDRKVGLGHRRLSILDLSDNGTQPMASASGRYQMVYNGETYNFPQLREELVNQGSVFKSTSDTEVILHGFEAWGIEGTITRLAGMFAIAVWDRQDKKLILIRDRVGIKPLYYGRIGGIFTFGSEISPLISLVGRPPVDRQALSLLLRHGCVDGSRSIYEGIQKLPPGTCLILGPDGTQEIRSYWDMTQVAEQGLATPFPGSEQEALNQMDALLKTIVSEHLISDVPIGAWLSGGYDSSTVVSYMTQVATGKVHTYSIGFDNAQWNEAPHAARIAEHLGTDHTELYLSDRDARDVIPSLPDIYDEPFADVSQIPTYLVSKLARDHVTVVLSGDGGDEHFGGYNRYFFVARFWKKLQRVPQPLRSAVQSTLNLIPFSGWERFFNLLERILPRHSLPSLPADKMRKIISILGAADLHQVQHTLTAQWPTPEPVLGTRPPSPLPLPLPQADDVSRQMAHDACNYMVDDILTKVDRASMAVSLEVRPPLLDHRFIEFAWSLPMEMKIQGQTNKYLLRKALSQYVPRELTDRPKMGFGVPIGDWLRGPLRDWAEDLLSEELLTKDQYLDVRSIRATWKAHLEGRAEKAGAIWAVLMFQSWLHHTRQE